MSDLEDRDRPSWLDETADPDVWSNVSTGEHRLTWREVHERNLVELQRLRPFARILSDLDRCEHGRHEGDNCYGCAGPSQGNPMMVQAPEAVRISRPLPNGMVSVVDLDPRQIGFALSGRPIYVPDPAGRTGAPEAWETKP